MKIKKLTQYEQFHRHLLMVALVLFVVFSVYYREYFLYIGFDSALFVAPLIILTAGAISLLIRWLRLSSVTIDTEKIIFKGQVIQWHNLLMVQYVEDTQGKLFLALHSATVAIKIPQREALLLQDLFETYAPATYWHSFHFPVSEIIGSENLRGSVAQSARKVVLPLVLFSVVWALWVWQLSPIWIFIWSAMSLLFPYFWVETCNFLLYLTPTLKPNTFTMIFQFVAYISGALYLMYGIFFVGNILR